MPSRIFRPNVGFAWISYRDSLYDLLVFCIGIPYRETLQPKHVSSDTESINDKNERCTVEELWMLKVGDTFRAVPERVLRVETSPVSMS